MNPIMKKIRFAFRSSKIGFRDILLSSSIRNFAGNLRECPITIAYSNDPNKIPYEYQQILHSLNVNLMPFQLSKDFQGEFFADFVKGAEIVEKKYANETDYLVWMGPDTLILKEPAHFLLPKGKEIGYRPVHHINIGSHVDSPLDEYWNFIYKLCNVPTDRIFPMETHIDLDIIRPYFNAGSIVVRPSEGLLQNWWNTYQKGHKNSEYLELCKTNPHYHIFFHQAILSGIILNKYSKQSLLELPKVYNYPLHLHTQNYRQDKPANFEDIITVRYETRDILNNAKLPTPIRTWIVKELSRLF